MGRIFNRVSAFFAGHEIRAALAGAVIGALISGITAWILSKQAISAQLDQATRENKAVVYSDFLQAAQTWADVRGRHAFCKCVSDQDRFSAFSDFRRKDINVGIFGTDEAREARDKVVSKIPDTWMDNSQAGAVDPDKKFDFAGYGSAVRGFVGVMCKELPSTPNETCSSQADDG